MFYPHENIVPRILRYRDEVEQRTLPIPMMNALRLPRFSILPPLLSGRMMPTFPLHQFPINPTFLDPIAKAVEKNDLTTLSKLLRKRKKHGHPLAANFHGWTAFHLAASKPEYKECLALLLLYDSLNECVRRNDTTSRGETPLYIACKNGCEENVLMLLRKNCDLDKNAITGYSALHVAARQGHIEIVRHLLNHGMNIDVENIYGQTSLHLSAKGGHCDMTGVLIANGANILSVDNNGKLPLHYACQYGSIETAYLLLEDNPTTINEQDSNNVTPYMLAVSNFHAKDLKYLLDMGARTDVCDFRGRFNLCFVDKFKHVDVLSLVLESTSKDFIEQTCVSNMMKVLYMDTDGRFINELNSFMCGILERGPEYLNVLLNSDLPRSLLQMPSVKDNYDGTGRAVFTPLAYLFKIFLQDVKKYKECLELLLKHNITMMDEFRSLLNVNWPTSDLQFVNPLSMIIFSLQESPDWKEYFNMLIANNVTIDYCLQCYHKGDEPYATFNEYKVYYAPVIYALENYDLDKIKLLVSNSVILEPDILCNYLIMAYSRRQSVSAKNQEDARSLYQYLIDLKPVYYKWDQQYNPTDSQSCPFMPAAEHISDETLARFCGAPYTFQRCPIFRTLDAPQDEVDEIYPVATIFQPFPYIKATEEFANVKLQQLCRTAIRQQLRQLTLQDNLQNFQRRILELPLPSLLKNYLLFKQ